ncbi:hypothetical protein DFQ28_011168 [Apophysomyces sp. BC1034]|nr:hypothetical protein DFQ29_009474 [Apophysomyces sp. BC1021]KAG0173257.1 hypothetical protein DFQ30_008401 [Apophysomyces sp. BC1015]KAG0191693.1 hypothetical protein DFQ28_011168 [Apophysomyces sp. BC1034]
MTVELLVDAVNVVDLLRSMYFDEEFTFRTEDDKTLYENLHAHFESDTLSTLADQKLADCAFDIKTIIQTENPMVLTFSCSISLKSWTFQLNIPSAANAWLSRDAQQSLTRNMELYLKETEEPDRASRILETMGHVQLLAESVATEFINRSIELSEKQVTGPVLFVREYVWFPMIYTREKRGHIINWAPNYGVTGFLCPGKPGAMCLEGLEKNVSQFINDIKTVSWADLPASHRKMTSRWQERHKCDSKDEIDSLRRFDNMTEVTFELHGNFGNHNSLSMLQAWMKERGCGEAFGHLFEYEVQP